MKNGIFFDGSAAAPNPGKACFAFTHFFDDEEVHFECGYIGKASNNFSEYTALLRSLQYCAENGYRDTEIFGDSQLVVNQVNGQWKVKCQSLKNISTQCKKLLVETQSKLTWIPRDQNKRADFLSKLPLA